MMSVQTRRCAGNRAQRQGAPKPAVGWKLSGPEDSTAADMNSLACVGRWSSGCE